MSDLEFFHRPASVAVVGASDDPDKIGGRPLRYMRDLGYPGVIIPVNPRRGEVQGLAAVPSLDRLDQVPDVAVIAVPGQAAVDAVAAAAALGVPGCVVMSSGFGETSSDVGRDLQAEMLGHAARTGMRIVGPNAQGLANFECGAVLSFSTLFTEDPPMDGPVAIISQSGAMCSVPYGMLRRRGIGVRYAHGTGNDADVTAAELAVAALADHQVRLVLLYLENISDPESLVLLGRQSVAQGVPVVALVGGRTASGHRAAVSHTGALATERRVLDAFFERIGIWQVRSVPELVAATELYLAGWAPQGSKVGVISNSGAVCVLAADAAESAGLPLAELEPATRAALAAELPSFATTSNPVDVTAALLTDSSLFGRVLPIMQADPAVDACLLGIPVAGRGYDVPRFARDAATFASCGTPLVLAIPQPTVAQPFREAGLVVFEDESTAIAALAQYLGHCHRMRRAAGLPTPAIAVREAAEGELLNEYDSLELLAEMGVPVVPHDFARSPEEVATAYEQHGGARVAVKGCTGDTSHKSELGLVELGCASAAQAQRSAERIAAAAAHHGVRLDGFLVAPMVCAAHETMLGAHIDPVFGPVMLVGSGGVHVEAVPDSQVLIAPCTPDEVYEAIGRLRIAPVLAGTRGAPPADVDAWVRAVVNASRVMADPDCGVAGFDANPLMLDAAGAGALAVDAVAIARR